MDFITDSYRITSLLSLSCPIVFHIFLKHDQIVFLLSIPQLLIFQKQPPSVAQSAELSQKHEKHGETRIGIAQSGWSRLVDAFFQSYKNSLIIDHLAVSLLCERIKTWKMDRNIDISLSSMLSDVSYFCKIVQKFDKFYGLLSHHPISSKISIFHQFSIWWHIQIANMMVLQYSNFKSPLRYCIKTDVGFMF